MSKHFLSHGTHTTRTVTSSRWNRVVFDVFCMTPSKGTVIKGSSLSCLSTVVLRLNVEFYRCSITRKVTRSGRWHVKWISLSKLEGLSDYSIRHSNRDRISTFLAELTPVWDSLFVWIFNWGPSKLEFRNRNRWHGKDLKTRRVVKKGLLLVGLPTTGPE